MNANDYKRIMQEQNLISTFEAEQQLANAKKVQDNINFIKALSPQERAKYPVDPQSLINDYTNEKESYIRSAILLSRDKATFSNQHELELWEVYVNQFAKYAASTVATVAGIKV